jgi:hypothetical protein
VFQIDEEPLTGQSGPVNFASKMAPKEKTPEKGQRKTKEKGGNKRQKNSRQESPKGKEVATIRDEPETNLFLGCLLSINQPLTGETIQHTTKNHPGSLSQQLPHHQHRPKGPPDGTIQPS